MTHPAVHISRQGAVLLVTLARPDVRNAVDTATAQALQAIQTVDVATGCGHVPRTTDGIHPTPAEHARMDALIRAAVLAALHDAG